ncbi:MAG: V-type ATPase subunit [Candidatus Lokiarchaeota archaeon]|nr:V-type ATPase subunit [Candidatus Lokiarchaeota archaeon]
MIIEELERAVYNAYIKIIGKLMHVSPPNMRNFLRTYLYKYEILNIKEIILGSIVGMSAKEKSKNINFLIEEYLENTKFIKDLIKIQSLEEIQLFLKGTKYGKVVKEGILYYRNTNEVFVLEAFLDRLYYEMLITEKLLYNRKESEIINTFIDFAIEIYNLKVIYRGVINKIDKNLLRQLIVGNYFFLDREKIEVLIAQKNIDEFLKQFEFFLRKSIHIKYLLDQINIRREHFVWSVEALYSEFIMKKFHMNRGDIAQSTIYRIIELIIKKEKEIRFAILPTVINIFHEKYEKMESRG